jgi:(p)ppGpp synthase/HD superfamily hydrolase
MSNLERALKIAVDAHAGQREKNGSPYVFHPIRVSMRCTTPAAKIVGLLHDVVEDTKVTMEDLRREGFSQEVLDALVLVTHAPGALDDYEAAYDNYIAAIRLNPIAAEVKRADLEDNMDVRRLPEIRDKDVKRLQRYARAYRTLGAGS